MKILALFLLSVAALGGTCFGGEPDASVLALGAWSQPVRTPNYMKLRGRLKICEYPNNRGLAPSIDVALYVELQEFSDSVGGLEEVYFDPQALKCELTDSAGKAVPRSGGAFSGAVPGAVWINLPSYCSEVLRVTPYNGGGRMPDGGFRTLGQPRRHLDAESRRLGHVLSVRRTDRKAAGRSQERQPAMDLVRHAEIDRVSRTSGRL